MTRRSYSATAVPTTLVTTIGPTDTSMVIADITGWPDGTGGPFIITVKRGQSGEEKILVGTRSGTTLSSLTRGFEGTTAVTHQGGESVEHTQSKTDLDEANAHINATTGAHPASAITNTPAGNIAATTVQAAINELDTEKLDATQADALFLTPAEGNAAYLALGGGTLTGEIVVPDLKVTGLTGSVQASRYVGATTSGAPSTGAHLLGDWVIDLTGKIFICTTAGTPGTWTQVGASASAASVNTTQTTSTAVFPYVDLTTVGPAVTLTTGASVLVHFAAGMSNSAAGSGARCAVVVSGATTRAGIDTEELYYAAPVANYVGQWGRSLLITGLTPGSNTFTLKYGADGNTASFKNRYLSVMTL